MQSYATSKGKIRVLDNYMTRHHRPGVQPERRYRRSHHGWNDGKFPIWTFCRSDKGLSASLSQRRKPKHHAMMYAVAAAARRQAGLLLCADKEGLQRQQNRQQQ